MMPARFFSFFERYRKITPFLLFIVFLVFSIPGVNWGVPALWNPDELIWRVDLALNGEMQFDETEPDFNYPSLPKYVMFAIGKIVYGLGYSRSVFIISARVFSALLGAAGIVLVYHMSLAAGARSSTAGLAGLLCIASGVIPANSRLAHNDIYLMFFSVLCVFFAIKYHLTKSRVWIYACFVSVGMAASSKYTGGSLFLLPLFVLMVMNFQELKQDWLKTAEIFFIGSVLRFLGFAAGTPKSLLWMTYYFKRVMPALEKLSLYSFDSGNPIGLYGQWAAFRETVGVFLYLLFSLAVIWFVVTLILTRMNASAQGGTPKSQIILILFASLLFFDMPFLFSVHYLPRHFIPFVPILSILAALFIEEFIAFASEKGWRLVPVFITGILFIGVSYSFLRLISMALLFANDARMPAGEYIAHLPGDGKTIEYTLYPPVVDRAQFEKARNYPVYFVKYPGETVPTGGRFEYNQGEQGLIDRDVDYLVIDTLTYSRLYTDSICRTNPVECDFFKRLIAGQIPSFRLMKEFVYQLPPYLPVLSVTSVNPEVRIYERIR
jgi:4-amino-4-deoxy-L-arabinose transferase-like glycosyltransferase